MVPGRSFEVIVASGSQSNLTEEFFYDAPGRLDYSRRNGVQNLDLAYEANGNLAGRTEGGVSYQYLYGYNRPHAVETVLYCYGHL